MQPVGRPLGAVPRSGDRVAFRVRASSERPAGDRPAAGELRIRAALTISVPQTPRLLQSAEDGERRPFRRRGLGVRGEVSDPQAEERFDRSRLDPSADDEPGTRRLTRRRVTLAASLRNRGVEIAE